MTLGRYTPNPATASQVAKEDRRSTVRAIRALWTFSSRPKPDGGQWGDIAGFDSFEQFRAPFQDGEREFAWRCSMALSDPGLEKEEAEALKAMVEIDAALSLKEGP